MTAHATHNLGALFDDWVASAPERVAMIDGGSGRQTTYSELAERVARAGNAFRSFGVDRGDRVALCYSNDTRFIRCYFGLLRIGAVPVPINVNLGSSLLDSVFADAAPQTLVLGPSPDIRSNVMEAASQVDIDARILYDGNAAEPKTAFETASLDERMATVEDALSPVSVRADDPAVQFYSSGATGRPKGIVLDHGGTRWNTRVYRKINLLDAEDRMLVVTPVFHKVATVNLKAILAAGGSFVLMPSFDAASAIEAISEHEVTFLTGVPAVYRRYVQATDALAENDVTSVSVGVCGGDALTTDLHDAFESAFDAPLIENYGLTEGGPMVASTPRWGVQKRGSCGLPLPGVDVMVVDPEGTNPVGVGEVGELLVSSPGVGQYHDRPEVTASAFVTVGGVEFLRTGDLAAIDADGYLTIEGRVDDMFVVGGENIYPVEVEELLGAHPAVSEVVVVPVPHDVKGRAPVAFVVPERDITAEELQEYALEHGPAYAHPRRVFFVESFPHTGTDKIDRDTLEADATERVDGSL